MNENSENDNNNTEPLSHHSGIYGLHRTWAIAVQLVGTFGLAVFLVLYYVLVMEPRAQEHSDRLRQSVDSLIQIVERGQSLVTREQGDRLVELYLLAVAPELTDRIEKVMPDGSAPQVVSAAEARRLQQDLQVSLEELLIVRTYLLRGLSRKDGETISDMLVDKIRSSGVAEQLAERTVIAWPFQSREDLVATCKDSLHIALRGATTVK